MIRKAFGWLVLLAVVGALLSYAGLRWPDSGHACTALGAGVAHADEDCLHQNSTSKAWAAAQQQLMAMNDAPDTTGLLFTKPNGTDSTPITSGKKGSGYVYALRYLTGPGRQQAAEHVEPQAAALMREEPVTYGALVINANTLCGYVMRVGCLAVVQGILPVGSTMLVWTRGADEPITIQGSAR